MAFALAAFLVIGQRSVHRHAMAINPKYSPAPRGKHQLRFSYNQRFPQWEATIELPCSPFQQPILKVIVVGPLGNRVTEDQLALIDRILDRLPELIPFVVSKLRWDSSFEDPMDFRDHFTKAHIWLSEQEEHPRRSWTFVVEKLDDEGDAIWGIYFEFNEDEFQEMWGAS